MALRSRTSGFPLDASGRPWNNSVDIVVPTTNIIDVANVTAATTQLKNNAINVVRLSGDHSSLTMTLSGSTRSTWVYLVPNNRATDRLPTIENKLNKVVVTGWDHHSNSSVQLRHSDTAEDNIYDDIYCPLHRVTPFGFDEAGNSDGGDAITVQRCGVQNTRGYYDRSYGYDRSYIHMDNARPYETNMFIDCWATNNTTRDFGDLFQIEIKETSSDATWGTGPRYASCPGVFIAGNTAISTFNETVMDIPGAAGMSEYNAAALGYKGSPENNIDMKAGAISSNRGIIFGNISVGFGPSSSDQGIGIVLHNRAYFLDVRSNIAIQCTGNVWLSDYDPLISNAGSNVIEDNLHFQSWKQVGVSFPDTGTIYRYPGSTTIGQFWAGYNKSESDNGNSNAQIWRRNTTVALNPDTGSGGSLSTGQSDYNYGLSGNTSGSGWTDLVVRVPSHLGGDWATYTIPKIMAPNQASSPDSDWVWRQDLVTGGTPSLSPASGTVGNAAGNQSFVPSESGSAVYSWSFVLGTSVGGSNYHDTGTQTGAMSSEAVTGLPTDGSPVYARLRYRVTSGGPDIDLDYVYTSYLTDTLPTLVPVDGSTLNAADVTFTIDRGSHTVQEWNLEIGDTVNESLYRDNPETTGNTISVTGLPTDGSALNVNLWYRDIIGVGLWQKIPYFYTAFTLGTDTGTDDGDYIQTENGLLAHDAIH